jgi:hypothetical protein
MYNVITVSPVKERILYLVDIDSTQRREKPSFITSDVTPIFTPQRLVFNACRRIVGVSTVVSRYGELAIASGDNVFVTPIYPRRVSDHSLFGKHGGAGVEECDLLFRIAVELGK